MDRSKSLRICAIAMACGAAAKPSSAKALPNDLQIAELGQLSDPNSQERFRLLGDEVGMSLAAATLEPANTVGVDGFDFGYETSFVFVNPGTLIGGQSYWATTNAPPSCLVIPAIHFRKGLPYSFEFEGRLETIGDSSMFAGQAGLKWGILEGFRYSPDLSVRFNMTRLFGQSDFDSTSGTVDVTLGKEFGIAGLFSLSPYLGYALTGVDSLPRVIWSAPNTSQSAYEQNPINGQELFGEEKWQYNLYDRFYVGLQMTMYVMTIGIEYDLARPSAFSSTCTDPTQCGVIEPAFPVTPVLSTFAFRVAVTL